MTEEYRGYLQSLPDCQRCHRPATVELRNSQNAPMARYCGSCGKKALKQFKETGTVLR
jgi:hypothetical protein